MGHCDGHLIMTQNILFGLLIQFESLDSTVNGQKNGSYYSVVTLDTIGQPLRHPNGQKMAKNETF